MAFEQERLLEQSDVTGHTCHHDFDEQGIIKQLLLRVKVGAMQYTSVLLLEGRPSWGHSLRLQELYRYELECQGRWRGPKATREGNIFHVITRVNDKVCVKLHNYGGVGHEGVFLGKRGSQRVWLEHCKIARAISSNHPLNTMEPVCADWPPKLFKRQVEETAH